MRILAAAATGRVERAHRQSKGVRARAAPWFSAPRGQVATDLPRMPQRATTPIIGGGDVEAVLVDIHPGMPGARAHGVPFLGPSPRDPATYRQAIGRSLGAPPQATLAWSHVLCTLNASASHIDRLGSPAPMSPLPILTRSLRLRHIVVEDAARMMELNAEPTTSRWLPSHVYANLDEATSRMRYLIACCSTPSDPRVGPIVLAVEYSASEVLLGHVGFSPYQGDVEVSYAIAEDSRGRGYGSEALLQACLWAAASFHLPRLLALTESGNTPSRRTLERAAFVHEDDTLMRFQGSPQLVSRYVWRPSVGKDREA